MGKGHRPTFNITGKQVTSPLKEYLKKKDCKMAICWANPSSKCGQESHTVIKKFISLVGCVPSTANGWFNFGIRWHPKVLSPKSTAHIKKGPNKNCKSFHAWEKVWLECVSNGLPGHLCGHIWISQQSHIMGITGNRCMVLGTILWSLHKLHFLSPRQEHRTLGYFNFFAIAYS